MINKSNAPRVHVTNACIYFSDRCQSDVSSALLSAVSMETVINQKEIKPSVH